MPAYRITRSPGESVQLAKPTRPAIKFFRSFSDGSSFAVAYSRWIAERRKTILVLSSTLSVTSFTSGSIFTIVPTIPPMVTTRSFFLSPLRFDLASPVPASGAGNRENRRAITDQDERSEHQISLRPLASPLAGRRGDPPPTAESTPPDFPLPSILRRARAAAVHKPIRATSGTTSALNALSGPSPGLRGLRLSEPNVGRANRLSPPLKSPLKSFDHAACVHVLDPRAVILDGRLPSSKLKGPELQTAVRPASVPQVGHQPLIVGHIVQREQNRAEHLVGHKQMPQISAAELPANGAFAFLVEGPAVPSMAGIPEPQQSLAGKCHRVSAVPGRHHAIEQVNPSQHAFDQVDRPADAPSDIGADRMAIAARLNRGLAYIAAGSSPTPSPPIA